MQKHVDKLLEDDQILVSLLLVYFKQDKKFTKN